MFRLTQRRAIFRSRTSLRSTQSFRTFKWSLSLRDEVDSTNGEAKSQVLSRKKAIVVSQQSTDIESRISKTSSQGSLKENTLILEQKSAQRTNSGNEISTSMNPMPKFASALATELEPTYTSRYQKDLDRYFANTDFQLAKDEVSVAELKAAMSLVYLRERPLISIDVEAWERSLSKVTEIGVAIYDPQAQAGALFPMIKCVHLIIREHARMFNGKFVSDNKHNFMGGTSYQISLKEAKVFLDSLLKQYVTDQKGVLVGHQVKSDIKWLRQSKIKIEEDIPTIDTLKLHQMSRSSGGTLKGTLKEINVPHAYLHNAANDAYYTLIAAMTYCDPNFRKHFNLDVFKTVPPKSKSEKRKEKSPPSSQKDRAECITYDSGGQLYHHFSKDPGAPCLPVQNDS